MNILQYFLKNCSKIHSRTHQITPFKKNSRGSIPPNPLAYKWLRHALHGIGVLRGGPRGPWPPPLKLVKV